MEVFSRFIALCMLFFLFPLLLVTSILSLIFQGKPVLFRQERVGYKFKCFKIYKFRTMKFNTGELITQPGDLRITHYGKILRKTKVDELPQLLNIIKGDMRFIGPRPEVKKYVSKSEFQFLEKIKPGISDYSSIIFRNETQILKKIGGKNPYSNLLPIKLKLSEYYSIKKSFFLDFKLVIITAVAIIFPDFSSKVLVVPKISKEIPELKYFFDKYLI